MQTQINPSLQALLQTAQMVTPEQGPTVAAKVAQAAQQKMQSQAAPPGIEALLPGVQQQAAQAAQAAQPATQGDVNQLRQMLAQAQQGQGVAQLPGSDVEMAEGGIVGYNGEGPSFVERLPEESGLRKMLEWLASGRPRLEKPLLSELTKRYEETPPPAAAPSAPRPMSEAEIARLQEANTAPAGVPIGAPSPRPPSPRPPAPERAAQRQPAAETAKPADAGIASLMGPPVPSGSERQFAEALAARGRMEVTPERTAQQFRKEREDYYRSLGIDPDFAKQRMERIAAQEKRDQEEAAARAALVKERGIENLISRLSRVQGPTLFGGLGAAQRGMEPIVAEQRRSDERFTALMRERQIAADKERTAVEDMQRALADGDIAKAEKSRNEALASRNAKNASEAEIRSKYAPYLLQAETAAQDRASRERQHELDRRAQAALRSLPTYEQLLAEKVMKDWMSKNPDKTLADAWDFYRGAGKPTDRSVLTYAQAAKIVDERLSELGTQFALNKEEADAAKREKRTPRTLAQMREDLIRKEMAMAGRTAGSAAPASPTTGGAVDKNNPLLK